ncbi:hypothetical protein [Massilia sp. S19_KUP03_FR1]|uniref:hypothetical protein n=1 Tax=Massilia sp. S19_KUP03_FR1 TaxID=3025503 RepID=UPI002FCCD198
MAQRLKLRHCGAAQAFIGFVAFDGIVGVDCHAQQAGDVVHGQHVVLLHRVLKISTCRWR